MVQSSGVPLSLIHGPHAGQPSKNDIEQRKKSEGILLTTSSRAMGIHHSSLQIDDAIPVQEPPSSSIKIPSLPNEILIDIADHLQQLRDILSFAQCSRRTYQSLERLLLWRSREFILLVAALRQNDDLFEKALQLKPIVNQRDAASGHTPISLAVQSGHTSRVRRLLGIEGIDLHSRDTKYKRTPLGWAVETDNLECIHLLLGHPGMTADTANDCLCIAAKENKLEAARVFIDHGVDLNVVRNGGDTPVAIAMRDSNLETSNFFVNQCHVDYTVRSSDNRTLVLESALCGDLDLVKRVVDRSPEDFIHLPDEGNYTPLLVAVQDWHEDIADFLLSLGADPCVRVRLGFSALLVAAERGYEELVRKMIDQGADPNFCGCDGVTPLMGAAYRGHSGTVRVFFDVPGIDINQGDVADMAPLMYAVYGNRIDTVRLLLDTPGIDINKRDRRGWSAYIFARFASSGRRRELEDLLVARGADTLRWARMSQMHHRSMWGGPRCGNARPARRKLP